jgi:hypothetical protein
MSDPAIEIPAPTIESLIDFVLSEFDGTVRHDYIFIADRRNREFPFHAVQIDPDTKRPLSPLTICGRRRTSVHVTIGQAYAYPDKLCHVCRRVIIE